MNDIGGQYWTKTSINYAKNVLDSGIILYFTKLSRQVLTSKVNIGFRKKNTDLGIFFGFSQSDF